MHRDRSLGQVARRGDLTMWWVVTTVYSPEEAILVPATDAEEAIREYAYGFDYSEPFVEHLLHGAAHAVALLPSQVSALKLDPLDNEPELVAEEGDDPTWEMT